ncbi:MAG: hypothetical protein JNM74_12035, partial [Myxococcales bacterium]|nr:hypothetical protein [Myxococcales bacterium]
MKRGTKFGALGLVVALSAASSNAFAQDTQPASPTTPPAASGTAPTTAPDAQQPPADNAAPAAASGGISLGTGAPKKDAPAEAKKEPEKKPKPRPFAGTQVFLMNALSTATVIADQNQYRNPTFETSAFILPRYTINKEWQLRGRTTINYEWTNSDSTQTRNEIRFGDTGLQLFYRGIPAFAGIKPQIAIGLTAPTSPESRARTMIVTPALT